ncbi:Histone transcription regulator 3 [Lithohypha guttulata]|nr:Histone transcription regulator 3 [Lithohypha guttulata]
MSSWSAINVEEEDDTSPEVDDTKEIQLEEALKLYQNALRLHSQGPAYYQAAREAYDELFSSEVFKYPEAASDFDHDSIDEVSPVLTLPVNASIVPIAAGGASDNANSLPQLLYLAYKSRAQFEIDTTYARLDQSLPHDRPSSFQHYGPACQRSLADAAAALERDDTDLDLWKRAGRVADVLQTARVVRFCLESVLAGDEEGDDAIDLSGLDEAYAKGELQAVVDLLQDNLTGSRSSSVRPRTSLLHLLKGSNDPYPCLPPKPHHLEYVNDSRRPLAIQAGTTCLPLSSVTYLAVTEGLLQLLASHTSLTSSFTSGTCIQLQLPQGSLAEATDTEMEEEKGSGGPIPVVPEFDSPASSHLVLDNADFAPRSSHDKADSDRASEAIPPAQQDGEEGSDPSLTLAEPVTLPSRKRSSTAAGIDEPEARSKSKRIKARESLVGTVAQEDEIPRDPSSLPQERFPYIESADEDTFKFVDSLLDRIGTNTLGSVESLGLSGHDEVGNARTLPQSASQPPLAPILNMKQVLKTWNEEKSSAFSSGHGGRDHVEKSTGLMLFLKHSKSNVTSEAAVPVKDDEKQIRAFVDSVNCRTTHVEEALFSWLLELLTSSVERRETCPYLQNLWSEQLKQAVVKAIVFAHEELVSCFQRYAPPALSADAANSTRLIATFSVDRAAEFAQAMFELHLDIYSEVTNPASTIDEKVRKQELSRLQAWTQLAMDTVQNLSVDRSSVKRHIDQTIIRFLWSSVAYAKHSESTNKSHVLLCLEDLRAILSEAQVESIRLPNNTAMPIISVSSIEQEVSRLKTLDFFMSVFDSDNDDPLSVILKLEPILDYSEYATSTHSDIDKDQIESFRSFLSTGDASLTLFLWKRLQNAYTAISYNTKVVSCLLRSLETIVRELSSLRTRDLEDREHEVTFLRWLRDSEELVTKIMGKVSDDNNPFECIDEEHLKSSTSAVVYLTCVVHEFVLVDDSLRCGIATPPTHRNTTAAKNFEKARDRFRELYVKLWTLLYWMIKEATCQMAERFEDSTQDLILFLRYVHTSLGQRQYCKYCNKLFVRTTKAELFTFDVDQDLSLDIAQVIYDLYGIRLSAGHGDTDHGCPAENLDRDKRTAHTLVPIIMDYVKRLNVKDLLRSDLKATIDRIQSALGQTKSSTALTFNRKAVSSYLKSVINPQALYQCLRGIGELETRAVHGDFASIAATGWYLLLGNMTLAKYKSVKRVSPIPTDELENAQLFLRQDIEHDVSHWESWYRLAQVYDAKIEDSLIWNSNKLNDSRADLATLERNAINAYTMATATAMRSAEDNVVTTKLINDMLFEFGTRIYSSSRPPLNREAFNTEKAVRHLSSYWDQTMSKQPMFKPISDYNVWSFAAHLIRRSLSGEIKPWLRYYILGKCLWKMLNHPLNQKHKERGQGFVDAEDVVDAFTEAVARVPKKERSSDPILEPHYKLVSTIHKMHDKQMITTDIAFNCLQASQYAQGVRLTKADHDRPDWNAYILTVLKKLQNADKSSWHHRITARAAHILYHGDDDEVAAALGAKYQFLDSIFTKSMMMQVWKPEYERAGRHYVYTGRYLRFFTKILETLRDRSNLEQVVRRIRRKTTDFVDHPKVWEDAVTAYVELLRAIGDVPRGRERALFDTISFDDFTRASDKLETWAHESTTSTQYLDIIKDAIEMKKLNNSLMKGPAIDDLIGDAYACMYEIFVSQLPPEEKEPAVSTSAQGTFVQVTSSNAPTGEDSLDRMRLNNLLVGQIDGTNASTDESAPAASGLGIVPPGSEAVDTPPPEVLRMPAAAKPGRAKTITRREVQRRAEAAIGKPPPIKTPTLMKRSISINVPSIKMEDTTERDDDAEGSAKDLAHDASRAGSKQPSISPRNSPAQGVRRTENEGSDGDNEDEEDENEDTETASGDEQPASPRKPLFPGLMPSETRDEDEQVESDEEEEDDADGDRMADVEAKQNTPLDDDVEIPDSQDPPVLEREGKDTNGMRID